MALERLSKTIDSQRDAERHDDQLGFMALDETFHRQLADAVDGAKLWLVIEDVKAQMDRGAWPTLRERLAKVIAAKTRDEWCEIMDGTDVCFAPVLDLDEAPLHKHNVARQTFVEVAGVVQPAPAPRFSAAPGAIQGPPPAIGAHDREALRDWGFSDGEIACWMGYSEDANPYGSRNRSGRVPALE